MSAPCLKLFNCGDTVLATAGFRGDITTLQKLLRVKLTQYEHQHGESMGVSAVGQLLGNTLYGRRFFPYYTWNVVGGLDGEGVGWCTATTLWATTSVCASASRARASRSSSRCWTTSSSASTSARSEAPAACRPERRRDG